MSNYYKFSDYIKDRYGERVQKITVDAGFSCPNRDGKLSTEGCIYCDVSGFSVHTQNKMPSIEAQIEKGLKYAEWHFKAKKYMVYFQAYSNTYASVDELRKAYDVIRKYDGIVALAIGTRPDCVDEDIIKLIGEYAEDYEVWLELGLQSMHEKSLKLINRGHGCDAFEKAVKLAQTNPKINICAHIILGIPGESVDDMLETVKYAADLGIKGIKLHPLHVVRNTTLEEMYYDGKVSLFSYQQYLDIVIKVFEHLPKDVIIQRATAECHQDLHVAPDWLNQKAKFLYDLDKLMEEKETWQGKSLGFSKY